MKILFTQDALVNAGAERSHLEILSRFSSDVEVLLVYFYPKHDLKEAYQDAGIPLHFLDIPESYSFGTAISRLVHLIRKEKPDLLVSSLYRADIITRMASLITGVPLVGTLVNDSYGTYSWQEKKGIKYRLVWLLDRLSTGIPIHWIANSKTLVDAHVKTLGIKPEKVSVVYRGRVVPPPRSSVSSPWSVSPQTETKSSSPRAVSPQTETKPAPEIVPNNDKEMDCEDTGHGHLEDPGNFDLEDLPFGQRGTGYGEHTRPRSVETQTETNACLQAELDKEKRMSYEDTGHGDREDLPTGQAGTGHGDKKMSCEDTGHGIELSPIRHFISYGRFLERKGFQDLISAFAEVQQHYPDCTLTIYGEGNFRKQLEDLVQILKLQESVKLPGKVADPTDLLLTADCFVFPSWFEGFSGSLVEAMLSGIPLIASDIPMNLEAVTADKNALTFTVKDIAALSQQMRYAIEHPALMNELGSAARLEAIERFDIEKIAKEYEGVLRSIAAQNTPPRPSP